LTSRVVFRPQARDELLQALDWYDKRLPGLGAQFARTVDAAVGAVTQFPEGFPKAYSDFRQCVLRRFPYSLVYRQAGANAVEVANTIPSNVRARCKR